MAKFQNLMEIFKLLDKSNCRKCNEATCLAFAAAVFNGARQLSDCPTLDPKIIAQYSGSETVKTMEQEAEEAIQQLQQEIEKIDLSSVAQRIGGTCKNGKLTLKVMGKDFSVDQRGAIFTDIHVHMWVAGPVLNYILFGGSGKVTGNWVPMRELKGGKDWYRLFGQRCEKPIKKVADTYTDLFDDMVHLFSGHQVERHFESDISVVLKPLPKLPVLICYWKPEDGLESDLHLFFDEAAEDNLNIESIYTLGAGLALMFEKLAHRHG